MYGSFSVTLIFKFFGFPDIEEACKTNPKIAWLASITDYKKEIVVFTGFGNLSEPGDVDQSFSVFGNVGLAFVDFSSYAITLIVEAIETGSSAFVKFDIFTCWRLRCVSLTWCTTSHF